jgi:hypothetical protein
LEIDGSSEIKVRSISSPAFHFCTNTSGYREYIFSNDEKLAILSLNELLVREDFMILKSRPFIFEISDMR